MPGEKTLRVGDEDEGFFFHGEDSYWCWVLVEVRDTRYLYRSRALRLSLNLSLNFSSHLLAFSLSHYSCPMAAPTLASILKDIKARKLAPVYLLHGEEPYFIEQISDAIESNALSESEKVFNQIVLFGKDVDARTVIDYCRQYPMMSQYKVVIVKEAQMMNSDQFLALEPYIEKSSPTTILVLCYMYKKVDGRTSMMKTAKSKAFVFESKKLYDNQVPAWIESEVKEQGMSIDAEAVEVLFEYIGNDLPRIANEITKLKIGLKGERQIRASAVYDNSINREYSVLNCRGYRRYRRHRNHPAESHGNMKSSPLVFIVGTFSHTLQTPHPFSAGLLTRNLHRLLGRVLHFLSKNTKQPQLNILSHPWTKSSVSSAITI
jgi:DNA polymerase-3 subunit delta